MTVKTASTRAESGSAALDPQPTASPLPPRRAAYIPALDGVRGIAILLVLVFHFIFEDPHAKQWELPILNIASMGWIGVDLFFVLSGFLITSILVEAKGTAGYFKNFYMRRVLRIFPLYYGVLIVAFVLLPLVMPYQSQVFKQIQDKQAWLWLYALNLYGLWHRVLINWGFYQHFWSLCVEEHYYMVWPAVVFFVNRRWAMGICVSMIVAALAIRIGRVAHYSHADAVTLRMAVNNTYYYTFTRMDSLAVGSLLALASHGSAGIAAFRRPAWWVLGLCSIGLAVLFIKNGGSLWFGHRGAQTIGYTLLAFGSAALLVIAILAPDASLLGRFFSSGWLRFLGKYSYGIYVLHMMIHSLLEPYNHWLAERIQPFLLAVLLNVVIGSGLSVVLALLSWHLYEKHFLKLKRFFEYRKPTLQEPVNSGISAPRIEPAASLTNAG